MESEGDRVTRRFSTGEWVELGGWCIVLVRDGRQAGVVRSKQVSKNKL